MAAPQRKARYRTDLERTARRPEAAPKRPQGRAPGEVTQRKSGRGRAFVLLVVVPLLLMLGSVYLHTVASGLKGEAARLEEERARAEGEGERLEVRLTELSEPGRIRSLARKGLQMRDPGAQDFETYDGRHGEDVVNEGEQKKKTNE